MHFKILLIKTIFSDFFNFVNLYIVLYIYNISITDDETINNYIFIAFNNNVLIPFKKACFEKSNDSASYSNES